MGQIWRGHDSEPPKSCVPRYPWGLSAAPALTLKWTPLWSWNWNTHIISMRAMEDITITLHSHYSAGHEKPVSLTILFCSQPESGWRLCEPLPPRCQTIVNLRHLSQQHSPPPHPPLQDKHAPRHHQPDVYPTLPVIIEPLLLLLTHISPQYTA